MNDYNIDTTGFELGIPTRLEMLEQQNLLMQSEYEQAADALTKAWSDIAHLVDMLDAAEIRGDEAIKARDKAEYLLTNFLGKTNDWKSVCWNRLRGSVGLSSDWRHWARAKLKLLVEGVVMCGRLSQYHGIPDLLLCWAKPMCLPSGRCSRHIIRLVFSDRPFCSIQRATSAGFYCVPLEAC